MVLKIFPKLLNRMRYRKGLEDNRDALMYTLEHSHLGCSGEQTGVLGGCRVSGWLYRAEQWNNTTDKYHN